MAKVKVEVLAEQLSYSYQNPDGTHCRADYVRGQVLEMEEKDAENAAAGEAPKEGFVGKNSAGTHVFMYPPKTPGVARASVRILDHEAQVTPPISETTVTPAPAPKAEDPTPSGMRPVVVAPPAAPAVTPPAGEAQVTPPISETKPASASVSAPNSSGRSGRA